MITLAFDTCLDACSVALFGGGSGETLAHRHVPMSRGHAEALPVLIGDVTKEAGLQPHDIGQVAITRGPGTFTGVRIGVSAARGLAISGSIPIIAISSLEALAACAMAKGPPAASVAALIDARRGEVYAAVYSSRCVETLGPCVLPADGLDEALPEGELIVIGTGASLAAAQSRRFHVSAAPALPKARIWGLHAIGQVHQPVRPLPLYLRAPDAKPTAAGAQVRLAGQ